MSQSTYVPLEPLTTAEAQLLQINPEVFIQKHPERVLLDMKRNEDGKFELARIAVVVR